MSRLNKVLLVDDDSAVRDALGQTLDLGGYQPVLAASFVAAKDHITAGFAGVIVSDIRMPGKDGFALLKYARSIDEDLPVILLTGQGDVPTAVRGITLGAYDFLEKPCDPNQLLEVIEKALQTRSLVLENRALKRALDRAQHEKIGFLGVSSASFALRETIRRAGRSRSSVLISGERGSGRGHVARLIQDQRDAGSGLQRIDCFSPLDLSALKSARMPLLLTEIERLDQPDQQRLSAVLRGPDAAGVMATCSAEIETMVQSGAINDDLFYLLGLVRIHVPPLRDRPEDIPILFDKFLREEIDAGAIVNSGDGRAAVEGLAGLNWGGNLRALRNHAKRVAWGLGEQTVKTGLKAQLERVERGIIMDALRRHSGHASDTARALNLPRKTFYDRLRKLAIRPEDFRDP